MKKWRAGKQDGRVGALSMKDMIIVILETYLIYNQDWLWEVKNGYLFFMILILMAAVMWIWNVKTEEFEELHRCNRAKK